MKQINLTIILIASFLINVSGQQVLTDHSIWNKLLKTHVSPEGDVDYKGFKKEQSHLNTYLKLLSSKAPDVKRTDAVALTFWINAYNAFTVSLILEHYPIKSITQIDNAWDTPFIPMGNEMYSLNQIEHEIIRPTFNEPRIHFVLVCAAISCPKLLNEAYDPERLEGQMTQQTRAFINNPSKNLISENKIKISQLFNWYTDDFTKDGSLQEYINGFSEVNITKKATIEYLEYNWGLNEK